jgi:hypothetical protein
VSEFPTDFGQGWPKAYFEVPEADRKRVVNRSPGGDVVVITGEAKRWFARGVLYVPITGTDLGTDLRMGLGLYAEMAEADVLSYLDDYWEKTAHDADVEWDGKLSATRTPMYPELDGLPVKVRLDPLPGKRPNLFATPPGACCTDQRAGITVPRWHEYVRLMEKAE